MLGLPLRKPWPVGGAEWMPAGRPLALVPGGPLPSVAGLQLPPRV